jgi:hypothetical protein
MMNKFNANIVKTGICWIKQLIRKQLHNELKDIPGKLMMWMTSMRLRLSMFAFSSFILQEAIQK